MINEFKQKKKILIVAVLIIVVSLIAMLSLFWPEAVQARKVTEQLNLGNKFLTELQYEQAEAAYLAVISIDPKNTDAYLKLAESYVIRGEYDKAIEILNSALEELGEGAQEVQEALEKVRKKKEETQMALTPEPTATSTPVPTEALTPTPTVTLTPEQEEAQRMQLLVDQLEFDKSEGIAWPVSGNIIIPYSPNNAVYYATRDTFSTSDAIVISSEVGTEVLAATKGVVIDIEENNRTGVTVTLAVGNNINLIYGQLDVEDLKIGDVVEEGERLGVIAEPTRYYLLEGPNLYFKVMEGKKSIDPTELLR